MLTRAIITAMGIFSFTSFAAQASAAEHSAEKALIKGADSPSPAIINRNSGRAG